MRNLIYDDTVDFRFDEGDHLYTVSKLIDELKQLWSTPTPTIGVTTVTGILAKPALPGWAAQLAAYFMRDNVKDLKHLPRLAEEAKRQHVMEANKGKASGTVGHALVETLLKKEKPVLPREAEAKKAAKSVITAFKKWQVDFEPQPIAIEQACYSLKHDYAGKFDLLCEIDNKLTLVDFKTNKTSRYAPEGIYPDMFCQLGGYIQLLEEQLGVKVDDAMIVNLPKIGGEYKLKSLSDLKVSPQETVLYFLNALGLFKLNKDIGWKLKGA